VTPASAGETQPSIVLKNVRAGRDFVLSISTLSAAITIPHQIPPPPSDFIGRKALLEKLGTNWDRAGLIISGMGGAGKTALALKLAESAKPHYSDSQFYLDLLGTGSKPLSLRAIMVHVISSLRPDVDIPKPQQDLEGLYFSVLTDQRAILFFDNVRDASQVQSLLPPKGSLVFVTSRNHFSLPGFETIRLDVMSPQDAHALLLRIAPRIDGDVEELARACGYLPFALRNAGGVLANFVDLKPTYYLQQLQNSENRLKLVDGSLSLSYDTFDLKTRGFWRELAVFREAFDTSAAAAVWDIELADAREQLGIILRCSMLEWDKQTERYRLHDLAQIFADKSVESMERSAAQGRHAQHYAKVARAAYDVIVNRQSGSVSRGFELLYSDWVNIAAGQSWAAHNLDQNLEAARLCREYATRAAFFHLLKSDPPELIRWLEAAVRADRRLGDKEAQASDLSILGTVQVVVGDVSEAIKCHSAALSMSRDIGNHRTEMDELHRLMELHAMRKETRKAIDNGEHARVIEKELGDRRKEADTLAQLAQLYADSDDASRSIQYYQSAVEINHQLDRNLEEAESLVKLGSIYEKTSDASRAIPSYERAVAIYRRLAKPLEEAQTLISLGRRFQVTKEFARSVEALKGAARLFKKLENRQSEALALMLIGLTYMDSPQSKGAIDYADRSLVISREIGDQDLIVQNLGVLVSVHGQWGRVELFSDHVDLSVGHLKRQLAAAKELRALNKPLPQYMDDDALLALGIISLRRRSYDEAKSYLTEGLEVARSTGSKTEQAKILDSLSLSVFGLGDTTQAVRYARESLTIFDSLNDPAAALVREHLKLYKGEPTAG
jgi:tetratricopeptide (TPR) repeat protein